MVAAAVVAGALAAPRDPRLDELLGADGARALRAALAARARRWAAEVSPDVAFEATTLAAAAVALHGHEGPAVLAAPDVPGLDVAVARDAIADVEGGGCDLAIGAAHDGRPYLLAVRSVALLDELDLDGDWLRSAGAAGLRMGLLRAERRLAGPEDVEALALDPLAPAELRPLLTPRGA